jgi:hypothetical protein
MQSIVPVKVVLGWMHLRTDNMYVYIYKNENKFLGVNGAHGDGGAPIRDPHTTVNSNHGRQAPIDGEKKKKKNLITRTDRNPH